MSESLPKGWWVLYYVRRDGQERPAMAAASPEILLDAVRTPEDLRYMAGVIEAELPPDQPSDAS